MCATMDGRPILRCSIDMIYCVLEYTPVAVTSRAGYGSDRPRAAREALMNTQPPADQRVLGWEGTMLRSVAAFSVTVDVVVTVDEEKLTRRLKVHPEPCFTITDLSLWETAPDFDGPPGPLTPVGILFDERDAMSGKKVPLAYQWRMYAPTAMRSRKPGKRLLRLADHYGIAVLTPAGDGGWTLSQKGGPIDRVSRSSVHRFLEETLFAHMIDSGQIEEFTRDR